MTNSILKDRDWTQKTLISYVVQSTKLWCYENWMIEKIYMNEELFERLVVAIEKQSTAFPWDSLISALALIASWITIFLLLKERAEKNRPYMQVSFELIRGSLACIVIRNTGSVPLELRKMRLQPDFVRQLPDKAQQRIAKKENLNITIFPEQKWVLGLDISVTNIINSFKQKSLKVEYEYLAHNKRHRKYIESTTIDFEDYSGFLVYISELDEFKNSVDKLHDTVKTLGFLNS